MSQSATLYRISESVFYSLENQDRKKLNYGKIAKDFTTFEGTMWGLNYTLCKGQESDIIKLVEEIFLPRQEIGGVDNEYFQNLVNSYNYHEIDKITSNIVRYFTVEQIINISKFLNSYKKEKLEDNFDPDELSKLDIYPAVWQFDNSPTQGYNKNHIIEDFEKLKTIFDLASKEKDYILSFVG